VNLGPGNLDADPRFADPAGLDFHLLHPSPCRDRGDNGAVIGLYDFEGDPRIAYGTADMGMDEFYPHMYLAGLPSPGSSVELKFTGLPGTSPWPS
jgi:hypothetical protein